MSKGVIKLKEQAAARGVSFIESGMVVGLGHGSTALLAIERLAGRLREGQLTDIVGIPCSRFIEQEAKRLGVPLTTLEEHPEIDITIDGADEVDPNLNLIKGGGGAFLREKIVAQSSRREIIMVDESKLSPALGTQWPVPVEVIPFGWKTQVAYLESLGADVALREKDDGEGFITDHGNYILDCHFGPIGNPTELAGILDTRVG
ncbi:MAG: ribose-5-phosphate isomerase RpiA, partial [Anaerolineales bacterium]|nr:ribose-5-phosphate isomerase RpiA [Anaerolineales bacterium]